MREWAGHRVKKARSRVKRPLLENFCETCKELPQSQRCRLVLELLK